MSSPFIQAIRDHLRARNYSKRTENAYVYWILSYNRLKGAEPHRKDVPLAK